MASTIDNLDRNKIAGVKKEAVGRLGAWTAHNIHLGGDVYTMDAPQNDSRVRRVLQVAADIAGKPLDKLRVLDLACLEGQFGIEFAQHGAEVVAIEGREANLAKARVVKDHLSLSNLDLVLDDVLNLSSEKYGHFDVVLCLGILYHLDHPDVMEFVRKISTVCTRMAIIDTHFSLQAKNSYTWNGHSYWGERKSEHRSNASKEEKAAKLWQSLDNTKVFTFTQASLCNLLRHVDFTSLYECLNPYEHHNPHWPGPPVGDRHAIWRNRTTFVAIKGQKQTLLSTPITDVTPEIDRPERPEYFGGHSNCWMHQTLLGSMSRVMPQPLRQMLRKLWS
jgi:SAM-dependent methyltransferase